MRIFNSKLGKIYERVSNLKAIELLYSYYSTDEKAVEKVEKNLKLLEEPNDIKKIHTNIDKYLKTINKEAKQIYNKLESDFRFA